MRASERPTTWRGAGKRRDGAHRVLASLRWRAAALALLAAVSLLWAGVARSQDRIAVTQASAFVRHGADAGTYIDAHFELQLPSALRDAVDHGIALYFLIEVEVARSRWYWFDKRLLDESVQYRVSFSPLTRQYRLTRGGLAQPFDTLDQALSILRHVTQWRIADADLFDGSNTRARIRLRLDTSMLPKPFQVSAITERDWTLASDWYPLTLAAGAR